MQRPLPPWAAAFFMGGAWGDNPAMSMHFDLVDLRLMVHIAEANSLTKGAEASHISLPAASTRMSC